MLLQLYLLYVDEHGAEVFLLIVYIIVQLQLL